MKFDTDKCKVLYIDKKTPKHKYKLQESPIESVESHKDIVIIISHDLKSALRNALRQLKKQIEFGHDI